MRNALLLLLLVSLVLTGTVANAQTSVSVPDPRIDIKDNIIHIYYDILNSSPEDLFEVDISVTTEDGREIDARTLSGDVGKDIQGGSNKHIQWDLEADKIFLNAAIFFEIHATYIPQAEPEPEPPMDSPLTESQEFNRTSLILQSVAFPGIGLTHYTGQPHWIRGVAGYGCIAGSVISNLQARNTYNSIEDYEALNDKQEMFDKSVKQDNISEVLAFAAVGIWVTDFIWTMAGTSELRKISVSGSIDPVTLTPVFCVAIRF